MESDKTFPNSSMVELNTFNIKTTDRNRVREQNSRV